MKKSIRYFSILILINVLICCKKKNPEKTNNTKNSIELENVKTSSIEALEFKKIIDTGKVILLDVRTSEEVSQESIEGNSNINFYDKDFIKKINLIDKSKPICVYCFSGNRSTKACDILSKNGFKTIYNLTGGLNAWKKAKLPLIKKVLKKDKGIKVMSLEDFNKFIDTKKTVLVNFHTQWCAPCRNMVPIVDSIEKEKTNAIISRIDISKCEDIAKKFKIRSVPTFIIFKNKKETWRHSGVISKIKLKQQLN